MSTVALPVSATPTRLAGGDRLGACVGAVALVSMLAFEAMALAAAMPAIAAALDGVGLYALAFGGMLATSVLGMVLGGNVCDRQGVRRATAIGLLVFGAGLALAGAAPDMRWLVAGRVMQGLGGGMLGVALYVGMGRVVPQVLHPRLFALLAAAWVLPALAGPLLAAWLATHWGWRAVFAIVLAALPLVAALLLPAFGRVAPPRPVDRVDDAGRRRIAWAAVAAAGALLLHAAGTAGPADAAGAAGAGALSPILLVLGLAVAVVAATRLLPPGSLRVSPGLPAVVALRGLVAASFATAEVFIPLLLTREAGWTLAHAGLALSGGAVCWSLGSALQARVADRGRRRLALQAGFAALAAGIAVVALPVTVDAAAGWVVPGWALAGFGIGLAFPMLSVLTLALSPPAEQGRNASALQLADALGSSVALALAGALFAFAGAGGATAHTLVLAVPLALAAAGTLVARRAFA